MRFSPLLGLHGCCDPIRKLEILSLADRECHLDRINPRDRGEQRIGLDQIANLGDRNTGNTVDRRLDLRPFQIEFGLLDRGTGGFHCRLVATVRLDRIVELLLADCAFLRQRGIARHIKLGFS